MEKYSLERAQNEADKIRNKALDLKSQKNKGEPTAGNYKNANEIIDQEKISKAIQIKDILKKLFSNPKFAHLKEFAGKTSSVEIFNILYEEKFGQESTDEQFWGAYRKWRENKNGWVKLEPVVEAYEDEREKEFSMDAESLYKTLCDFCVSRGIEVRWENVGMYLPILAIVKRFIGEDMKGKTIVEVGPGKEGFRFLNYFSSLGANVIAFDVDDPGADFRKKFPKVRFIQGRWEEISEYFKKEKVDLIYTHYMHPNPELGGKFERQHEKFVSHIQKEMDVTLKPGGLYIHHKVETDFHMGYDDFEKMGYEILLVHPETVNIKKREYSNEVKKTFAPNGGGIRYGAFLMLTQKPTTRMQEEKIDDQDTENYQSTGWS